MIAFEPELSGVLDQHRPRLVDRFTSNGPDRWRLLCAQVCQRRLRAVSGKGRRSVPLRCMMSKT